MQRTTECMQPIPESLQRVLGCVQPVVAFPYFPAPFGLNG
jgi:hypothetical protein